MGISLGKKIIDKFQPFRVKSIIKTQHITPKRTVIYNWKK